MSIVSDHLQKLLGGQDSTWYGGYVNMLKQLEGAFQSPKHWVFEFLQNAEDAGARRISIRLGEDSLRILNDGNTFRDDDFYTICDVKSRKLPSLGFRGYIGIGFKSIFRVTDSIEVHSGNFHFRFDKKYWDDHRRKGVPASEWPWEILPVEIDPVGLKEGFTTGFFIPLRSIRGQEILEEIGQFLGSNEFPKEAILLLQKVDTIEVQTPLLSFSITKETVKSDPFPVGKNGKKEQVLVKRQIVGQQNPDEACYVIFKTTASVQNDVRQDADTERVRRSEIVERELGVVFSLDSDNNLQILAGKLAGVYSFLPVEGEETGLPFGIFGDFIPQIGRDLIQYGVKWNHWMCDEVTKLFKQIVIIGFLVDPQWKFFPAELLGNLQYSSLVGQGKEFWDTKLGNPVREFLESGALYPDREGITRRLSELFITTDEVLQICDKKTLETLIGKKMVHASIEEKIKNKVEVVSIEDLLRRTEFLDLIKGQPEKLADISIDTIYGSIYDPQFLEPLKNQPERLATAYRRAVDLNPYRITGRQGRDPIPLYKMPFVLADDGKFYPPNQTVALELDFDSVPEFLRAAVPILGEKKRLHPKIAQDPEAVKGLKECNLEVINKQTVVSRVGQLIGSIDTADDCPETWQYPDDLIQATLFFIAEGEGAIKLLVAEDGTLRDPTNLFVPGVMSGVTLDWTSLWDAHLVGHFQPIHKSYLIKQWQELYGLQTEKAFQYFEELGVHGFSREKDRSVIETAAYAIAEKRLTSPAEGHSIVRVTERDKLGYDFECKGHCGKVFEVKGMTEPRDVSLEPSEVRAAQQKKDDYILVCVYNLPANVGCKQIPDPESIWEPVERAKVPKGKWLVIGQRPG